MKRYIIERSIPGVGSLDREQFRAASVKSNAALAELGPNIQWVQSYVAKDKLFCVYFATGSEIIRKHAEISGFPATLITEIGRVIDPTTAQSASATA